MVCPQKQRRRREKWLNEAHWDRWSNVGIYSWMVFGLRSKNSLRKQAISIKWGLWNENSWKTGLSGGSLELSRPEIGKNCHEKTWGLQACLMGRGDVTGWPDNNSSFLSGASCVPGVISFDSPNKPMARIVVLLPSHRRANWDSGRARTCQKL